MIAQLRSIGRMLLGRESFERSMSAEMRFHMDAYADDLVRAGLTLLVMALLAGLLPARRAASIDPVLAIRGG